MAAIITDQLRILNAKNFVSSIGSSTNSYYSFVGLTNSTDYSATWDSAPPSPIDSFEQENEYWDTIVGLRKIKSDDVNQVIRKITWSSGTTYDMYRHDISIRENKTANSSGATSLYSSNFYVMNSDYRVYICLYNGTNPENPEGKPSLEEPKFTDLEPRSSGTGGDGYIWKYLYTIKPSDIIKFDTIDFIPVPKNWDTSSDFSAIRNNAQLEGNQLKIVTIKNRGVSVGPANQIYTNVPIKGDGSGARATIVINNDAQVESITISSGGSGYTFGTVDLVGGNVPTAEVTPTFDVIIPPKGGHGFDVYRELGASNVLIFSRIENDIDDPDFIVGNKISRIGIVENPQAYNSSSLLNLDKASGLYALRLTGTGYSSASFTPNSTITQTVGVGSTAVGRVVSYDQTTGVLKYWQDKTLAGFNTDGTRKTTSEYGLNLNRFTGNSGIGVSFLVSGTSNLYIDTAFSGVSTTINSRTYKLGQTFVNGVANPEVKKYSGNIIYVDNRPSITRSPNQREDIKVILQF